MHKITQLTFDDPCALTYSVPPCVQPLTYIPSLTYFPTETGTCAASLHGHLHYYTLEACSPLRPITSCAAHDPSCTRYAKVYPLSLVFPHIIRFRSRRDCLGRFMHWYQRVSAPLSRSRSTAPSSRPLTTQMGALAFPSSQLRRAGRSPSRCCSCVPHPPHPQRIFRASARTGVNQGGS